ncbi:hypothetical protein [Paraclostridium tenue]|uniref:Uncharacterized protein n=1 Tax=Paraclostridium tenue TaxID=1737 RepID=A0ABN1LXX9_9FIRM
MKFKLPFVLRKTYEKETNELVKDIRILESARSAADRKVKDLKEKLATNKYFSESREQEQNQEIERLKLALEQRDKKIENLKQDNFNMYKKVRNG